MERAADEIYPHIDIFERLYRSLVEAVVRCAATRKSLARSFPSFAPCVFVLAMAFQTCRSRLCACYGNCINI